jgi:hypothetical protein
MHTTRASWRRRSDHNPQPMGTSVAQAQQQATPQRRRHYPVAAHLWKRPARGGVRTSPTGRTALCQQLPTGWAHKARHQPRGIWHRWGERELHAYPSRRGACDRGVHESRARGFSPRRRERCVLQQGARAPTHTTGVSRGSRILSAERSQCSPRHSNGCSMRSAARWHCRRVPDQCSPPGLLSERHSAKPRDHNPALERGSGRAVAYPALKRNHGSAVY